MWEPVLTDVFLEKAKVESTDREYATPCTQCVDRGTVCTYTKGRGKGCAPCGLAKARCSFCRDPVTDGVRELAASLDKNTAVMQFLYRGTLDYLQGQSDRYDQAIQSLGAGLDKLGDAVPRIAAAFEERQAGTGQPSDLGSELTDIPDEGEPEETLKRVKKRGGKRLGTRKRGKVKRRRIRVDSK